MTSPRPDPPTPAVLALVPGSEGAAVEAAAAGVGLACVQARDMGGLLKHLMARQWTGTLVSLEAGDPEESLLRRIADEPNAGTLFLSAAGVTLPRALMAERAGAAALFREPLDGDEMAERLRGLMAEGTVIPFPEPEPDSDEPVMIGTGPGMERVFQTLARVAPTPSTVLITGESGTGKEVAARVIHWASPRRQGPFVAVNCAAIPEHLLESELFGHERGAFTGAVSRRAGRFERAHGGTLFLDEIGDMSLVLQAKILRVLEERRVERVGGEEELPVDVRIVAATNQPLQDRIRDGDFREDLFYRLAVVELALPPLRERGSDLRELALHYGARFSLVHGRGLRGITEAALRRLESHPWPGNVRELRNVMERAVLLTEGGEIRSSGLRLGAGSPRASPVQAGTGGGYPASLSMQEVEAAHIRRVLEAQGGHMGRTAEVLGIHRNTLTRKVQEYGLAPDADSGE